MTNQNPDHEPTTQFPPVEPEQGQPAPASTAADASRKRRLPTWAIALIALAIAAVVLIAVGLAKGSSSSQPAAASVTTTNVSPSISSSASVTQPKSSPTAAPAPAPAPASTQQAESAQPGQGDQQAPQQDSGYTGGNSGGGAHRQGQGDEHLPPPPPATEARQSMPPGAQRVQEGVYKGSNTSDQFATNVATGYGVTQGSNRGNATVHAHSSETGQTYTMSCVDYGGYVGCTGGNGASVYLPAADPADR